MPDPILDLSHHNPEPDWAKLKAGVLGVILKATEGTAYIDPMFHGRRDRAMAAGLPVCSYHFLKHGNVSQQMLHYLDVVAPTKGERVIIDYEDTACTLDDLRAAVQALDNASLDLQVTVYGGSKLEADLGSKRDVLLAQTSLWTAQYTTGTPSWPTGTWPVWSLWQYTDKATVRGITGPVDDNRFNGSTESALKWLGPAKPAVSVPVPAPEPMVEVSISVDPGVTIAVWLNGEQVM